jgi:hypothetical protein
MECSVKEKTEELNDYVDYSGDQGVSSARFTVDSKDKAIWAMRKIAKCTAEINDNNKIADAEIQKYENWKASVNEPHKNAIDFFTSLLEGYHRKIYDETDGNQKSIKLPHGVLKLRAQDPKYVKNEAALIALCKQAGIDETTVALKEELSWSEFKKHIVVNDDNTVVFTDTGELIERDTLSATKRGPSFSIKVVE